MSNYGAVSEILSKNPCKISLVYGVDGKPYFYFSKGEKHIIFPKDWEYNMQEMYLKKTIKENGLFIEYKIGIVNNLDEIM